MRQYVHSLGYTLNENAKHSGGGRLPEKKYKMLWPFRRILFAEQNLGRAEEHLQKNM
jgi:hypothetical protein